MSLVRLDEVVDATEIAFEPLDDCGADFELDGCAPLFKIIGVDSVVDGTVGEGVHDERRPAEKLPCPLLCHPCTSLSALQVK